MKIKSLTFLLTLTLLSMAASAQKPIIYHPEADAKADIASAVQKAKKDGKHVLLQLGGNWCSWCILFDKLVNSNDTLKTFRDKNYEMVHVNFSPENKNEAVFASLGYPQRFGFPVFVILDGDGKRLHTQSSGYLEQGKGHDPKKVLEFFEAWTPAAIDPKNYKAK
ncbi:thioredoxin family protein [Dyadobacter psychrotolerans]|uniref:Thioredoxin family protein n=1 Tax=Dyadobacter psychrotolerans TaxID=2541721 RepID=A0A4R5DL46_9BACT|nr:thioredoxin family protein [Dyadobacter psychrotolerans]TDE11353.1 thioredoxin family protein [Dyadobacter psychrotolerans]